MSQTNPLQNLILTASAGTGKTFTLTTHIIRLLAQKDDKGNFTVHPRDILALTFSKAAAFEIYAKLVTRLAKAAESEKEATKTNDELNDFTNRFLKATKRWPATAFHNYTLTHNDYNQLLKRVIATQHINNIATLDSFILRMVQFLPLELGLLGGVSLIEEYDKNRFILEAIQVALSHPELRKAISNFDDIADVRTPAKHLERMMSIQKDIRHNPELKALKNLTENDLAALLEVSVDKLDETHLPIALDATLKNAPDLLHQLPKEQVFGLKAIAEYFSKGLAQEDPFAVPSTYTTEEGEVKKRTHSKKIIECFFKNPHPESSYEYRNETFSLPKEIANALIEDIKTLSTHYLANAIRSQVKTFKIVQAIDAIYDKQTRQHGFLRFDDLPWFFYNPKITFNHIENIEYHFDQRFRHWAIDEFQDTSHAQWACLKSLVESAAMKTHEDQAHSVTIVGDVKQAIYAWRGGDERILLSLLKNTLGLFDNFPLQTSYRYQKHTCDFINQLFGRSLMEKIQCKLPDYIDNPQIKAPQSQTPLVDGWLSPASWMEHRPQEKNGHPFENDYVKVLRVPKQKDDTVDTIFYTLGHEITTLWSGRKNANETIGVLVASNEKANELSEYLRSIGLPAMSESESSIVDIPTVQGLLSLLKLIEHPDDTTAWECFTRTPTRDILMPEVEDLTTILHYVTHHYVTHGLSRLVTSFVTHLIQNTLAPLDPISQQRLIAIAIAAETFERSSAAAEGIDAFITYLETQTQRDIAKDPTIIRVITIHRSKGLGFDHVFLPVYETTAITTRPVHAEPFYGITNDIPWTANLNGKYLSSYPHFAKLYGEAIDDHILAQLHMYYVATTRSKQSLTVIYKESSSDDKLRFATLLDSLNVAPKTYSLHSQNPEPIVISTIYEAGTNPALHPHPETNSPQAQQISHPTKPSYQPVLPPLSATIERPSDQTDALPISDLFAENYGTAAIHGTETHMLLEAIEWIDPQAPKNEVEITLLNSPLREAFVRPDGPVELWREYSYDRVINETWQTGQFDRVIITGTSPNLKATIYDFKTNQNWHQLPLEDFAQTMAKKYHKQMAAYQAALSSLLQLPAIYIEAKLLLLSTKQVVTIE